MSEMEHGSHGLVISEDEIKVGGEVFKMEDIRSAQVGKLWPARFYWLSSLSGVMLSVVLWLGFFVMHSIAGDLTAGHPLESNGIIIAFLVIPAALYLASQNVHWIGFYGAFMLSFALFDYAASSTIVIGMFFGGNPAVLLIALGVSAVLLWGMVLFALDLAGQYVSVLRVSGAFGKRQIRWETKEPEAKAWVYNLFQDVEMELQLREANVRD